MSETVRVEHETLRWNVPEARRGGRVALAAGRLTLVRGANVGVAGLNGAGKTTLFLQMMGALRGGVRSDPLVPSVAFQPQEVPVPQNMSVVDFGRVLHGISRERVAEALHEASLDHLRDRAIASVSRGERQMLFLVFSLLGEADLVILDEPTASLDMLHRREAVDLIARRTGVKGAATVLVSSQLPEVLYRCCQHIIALRDGTIRYCGPRDGMPGYVRGGDPSDFERAILSLISS